MNAFAAWQVPDVDALPDEHTSATRPRVAPGKVALTQHLTRRRTLSRAELEAALRSLGGGTNQGAAAMPGAPATLGELEAELGSGAPLPSAIAARMRTTIGADVSAARIHTGATAAARAQAVGASAFAVGPHVVLGAGVDPDQPAGAAVLAHELVHVAQQAAAAARPEAATQPIGGESAHHEREAHQLGARASDGVAVDGAVAPIGSSELQLQRFSEEDPEGSKGRATPPWPKGPMTNRKDDAVKPPVADYLRWLRGFEQTYGVGPATVQRLRRLYYSAPTLGAGPKFDQMIDTQDDTLPTSPPLAQNDLDRLYEANAVITPQGDEVDLSHIFVLFDLVTAGTSMVGTVANQVTPLTGLFTWAGDLASWFVKWLDGSADGAEGGRGDGAEGPVEGGEGGGEAGGEPGAGDGGEGGGEAGDGIADGTQPDRDEQSWDQQIADLEKMKDSKCASADLMGNIDAHALASQAPMVAAGTTSMADLLDGYYGAGAAGGVERRFHRFVVETQPPIPYVMTSASPLTVALAPAATDAIYAVLYRAVAALRTTPIFPLEGYTDVLRYIAERFATFLRGGLASGSATW